MTSNEEINAFLAEAFIMELDTNQRLKFYTTPPNEHLEVNRQISAMKYLAYMGANISSSEVKEYVETDGWKRLWNGVWVRAAFPGKSVSVFFTNQYR